MCVRAGLLALGLSAFGIGVAQAVECAGHEWALGTSRVMRIEAEDHLRVGSMQYPSTLPLADREVVLTFDDGPLPAQTNRVLETLASHCVRATFFLVGKQATAFPDLVRRIYNDGHTVGTHSENHITPFAKLEPDAATSEITGGINSISAALGDARALAPYFRFPGLGRTAAMEEHLQANSIAVWSADIPADDWKGISSDEIIKRALERLERKGKGILLLHDIQAATALALPKLLHELKERGFRVVHVVPGGVRPKRVPDVPLWAKRTGPRHSWPRLVVNPQVELAAPVLPVPSVESFGMEFPFARPKVGPAAWRALQGPERKRTSDERPFEARFTPVNLSSLLQVRIR